VILKIKSGDKSWKRKEPDFTTTNRPYPWSCGPELPKMLTIFQIYCDCRFYWQRIREFPENLTDLQQVTDKICHKVVSSTPSHGWEFEPATWSVIDCRVRCKPFYMVTSDYLFWVFFSSFFSEGWGVTLYFVCFSATYCLWLPTLVSSNLFVLIE